MAREEIEKLFQLPHLLIHEEVKYYLSYQKSKSEQSILKTSYFSRKISHFSEKTSQISSKISHFSVGKWLIFLSQREKNGMTMEINSNRCSN